VAQPLQPVSRRQDRPRVGISARSVGTVPGSSVHHCPTQAYLHFYGQEAIHLDGHPPSCRSKEIQVCDAQTTLRSMHKGTEHQYVLGFVFPSRQWSSRLLLGRPACKKIQNSIGCRCGGDLNHVSFHSEARVFALTFVPGNASSSPPPDVKSEICTLGPREGTSGEGISSS
jgi:hypothetical protein